MENLGQLSKTLYAVVLDTPYDEIGRMRLRSFSRILFFALLDFVIFVAALEVFR